MNLNDISLWVGLIGGLTGFAAAIAQAHSNWQKRKPKLQLRVQHFILGEPTGVQFKGKKALMLPIWIGNL